MAAVLVGAYIAAVVVVWIAGGALIALGVLAVPLVAGLLYSS